MTDGARWPATVLAALCEAIAQVRSSGLRVNQARNDWCWRQYVAKPPLPSAPSRQPYEIARYDACGLGPWARRRSVSTGEASANRRGCPLAHSKSESRHILVVNDTEEILDLFRDIIEGLGHRMTAWSFSPDDLAKVTEIEPDLVIQFLPSTAQGRAQCEASQSMCWLDDQRFRH